jgi:16S rRNA C967 or C1407 C5-methylase (RsmB/RsmF family)
MIAQLMGDRGRVIALDRTRSKVAAVESLASDLGISIIDARVADSTQLAPPPPGESEQQRRRRGGRRRGGGGGGAAGGGGAPPDVADEGADDGAGEAGGAEAGPTPVNPLPEFGPESFDAILLDAPCSALGLRPRLLHDWRLAQLHATAGLQRALLHSAVHLLRPGGVLVYCTCTINPGEGGGYVPRVRAAWRGWWLAGWLFMESEAGSATMPAP